MKLIGKNLLAAASVICGLMSASCSTGSKALSARSDGSEYFVNITDVVLLVNYVLGDRSIYLYKFEADLNGDGLVNITDVVTLTNIILNNE